MKIATMLSSNERTDPIEETVNFRRSTLVVPAGSARALELSTDVRADVVMFDLHDTVAQEHKESARESLVRFLSGNAHPRHEVAIRINGFDTPWGVDDLVAAAALKPSAIVLPTVASADVLVTVGRMLAVLDPKGITRVWAMLETAKGILNTVKIANAAQNPVTRLACLVLGTSNLVSDTGVRLRSGRTPFVPWISQAVVAAKANRIGFLDGSFADVRDLTGFQLECEQGCDLGADGKVALSAAQVDVANEVFAPSVSDVDQAHRITEAFSKAMGAIGGAVCVDGRHYEQPELRRARRTLAIAHALS